MALGLAGVVIGFVLLLVIARQLEPGPPQVGLPVTALPEERSGDEVSRTDSVEEPTPVVSESPGASVAPLHPAEVVVRWVANWANVREGRSLNSPVLRVLRPGQEVVVANRAGGWWEVYLDGKFAGYVAGSLLLAERPPDSAIPR